MLYIITTSNVENIRRVLHSVFRTARMKRYTAAMAKTSLPNNAYQLKITLGGSKPPIWRRFVAPGQITLAKLHDVIQIVMGWYDSHLHAFEIDGEQYGEASRDGMDLDLNGSDERKFRLCDVIPEVKAKFRYEYDFGDSWEHALVVEKIIPADDQPETFVCLAGKGRCPLEDCGGIWGYYRLLEVLANPKDPEHADMKEWAGGKFDPDEFDLAGINKSLRAFRKS
jgi:Plasmid pRiA4b ORF-3-like protein